MADIEINIGADDDDDSCDCCPDCKYSSSSTDTPAAPAAPPVSKDALLAKLKDLLGNNTEYGRADRQMQIDELIDTINDMNDEDN